MCSLTQQLDNEKESQKENVYFPRNRQATMFETVYEIFFSENNKILS